jgi:endoglucanase
MRNIMGPMHRRELLKYMGAAGMALHPWACAVGATSPDNATDAGIFINQIGYLPGSAKQATIRVAGASQRDFLVRSVADRAVVFRGNAASPASDDASGDQTSLADFSSLRTPGKYQLEIAGLASDAFPVASDGYASALRLTMRGFYGQRCGCAVDLGDGYKHPVCHADGVFHATSGKSGALPNHGGWHDAGDYGRYVVNSGISTGTLLWAWEMYPAALRGLSLGIPESGGKLPDYLAEVRWNLEWMLQMQDTDGGVWHKQTSEHFCAFIMPQDDKLTSYVIGTGAAPFKSTGATADLASVMAIAARCYGPYDAGFAQRCLTAARQAWSWAVAHPDVEFENPPGISTGGYGDRILSDEIAWASAELWRTTGEAQYERAFLARLPGAENNLMISAPGWGDVTSMAYWTYALAERKGNSAVKSRIKDATQGAAATLIARSRQNGYGNTMELRDYVWGSNSVAANQSLLLLIARHFHLDEAAREAALNNLHYLLGRNCLGVSWVTQLGIRPFQHPHHRPSAADGIAAPWPGLLSGGPNAHGGDAIADKLPKQPPMRMWIDDQRAYSMNEIAINWNAPVVFLLAGANS